MDEIHTRLDHFGDDFLWFFLQRLDTPRLAGVRSLSPRFDTLINEDNFIRTYNREPRGSVWTYTHFHRLEVPHNHRVVGFRAGNDQHTVTYHLRDFGLDHVNHAPQILELVGCFRTLLVFWYQDSGFVICNIWNMTSRIVSLPIHLNHLLEYETMLNAIRLNAQGNDPSCFRLQLVHALGPN